MRDILDAAKDDPTSRIGMAYSSFLDGAGVEAKGLSPIQPWLDQVRALKSRDGYAALQGEAARNGITGLFGGGVIQDDRNTDIYITGLGQAGLGMPDRDMYLLPDANSIITVWSIARYLAGSMSNHRSGLKRSASSPKAKNVSSKPPVSSKILRW